MTSDITNYDIDIIRSYSKQIRAVENRLHYVEIMPE
jgi:hypothetical protein